MKTYVKCKVSGNTFYVYEKITNGYVLTSYSDSDGTPYVNMKFFVSSNEYKEKYEDFKFNLPTGGKENRAIAEVLKEINYQLNNHGIIEESSKLLMELNSSGRWCGLFKTMVENPNLDVDRVVDSGDGDDDYYYEESREAFNFIYSLVPVLKKFIIQTR